MKRYSWIVAPLMLALVAGTAGAGVVKSTKSQITFKGFGTFSVVSNDSLTADRKASETQSDFKGKGLLGGLAGKTILRSGSFAEITDLPALTLTRVDNKRKEYTVSPIKPMESGSGSEESSQASEKPAESDVKVTKSEFKVADTGETKDINGFPCKKYLVTWLAEWENTRTGQKGTTNLTTDVWTTPATAEIRQAQAEEMAFTKRYLKAMGIDADALSRDVLGGSWMSMMAAMSPAGRSGADLSPQGQQVAREMAKLQGYPIVIDGKYTGTTVGGEKADSEGSGGGGLGGMLGKLRKKKPADETAGPEPTLTYYVETVSIKSQDVGDDAFQVPAGYKKKG